MQFEEYMELAEFDYKDILIKENFCKQLYTEYLGEMDFKGLFQQLLYLHRCESEETDMEKWEKYKSPQYTVDLDDSKISGQNPAIRMIYHLLWSLSLDIGSEKNKSRIYENGWGMFRTLTQVRDAIQDKKIPYGGECLNTIAKYRKDENKKEFNTLYKSTHQLGNFCLVPAYFNQYKGSILNDNILSGLLSLRENKYNMIECSKKNLKDSKKSFKKEKIEIIEKNFKQFEKSDFNQYINQFFLWDYVYVEENSSEYKVLHENANVEVSHVISENIECYVKKATYAIERRSYFMAAMLMIAIEFNEGIREGVAEKKNGMHQ